VLLIVATPVAEEDHVTDDVRFCVVASEYVPVAMNCWVAPETTVGLAGVTLSETKAAVTVKVVLPESPELACVAVMVVLPMATVEASPLVPAALLMVATLVEDEDQVTEVVRFWVVPSV